MINPWQLQRLLQLILMALSALSGLFIGYFWAYGKKKGENLATHQDIDKLVDQVQAVTTAMKEIQTNISDESWGRQRQWELKREAVLEAIRKTSKVKDALTNLHAVYITEQQSAAECYPPRLEQRVEAGRLWHEAADEFDQATLLVSVACTEEATTAMENFGSFLRTISQEIIAGRPESFLGSLKEFVASRNIITLAMRKEITNTKST
jgi:hypothetical protein